MNLKIKRLTAGAHLPVYATPGAAAMDIHADLSAYKGDRLINTSESFADWAMSIGYGERKLISCGFAIELPAGYEAQIRSRSGLALKSGIMVLNSPGTIDSDYRGEIGVILMNLGSSMLIKHGDRIAQMVIAKVSAARIEFVEELGVTDRGADGFGSTGLR